MSDLNLPLLRERIEIHVGLTTEEGDVQRAGVACVGETGSLARNNRNMCQVMAHAQQSAVAFLHAVAAGQARAQPGVLVYLLHINPRQYRLREALTRLVCRRSSFPSSKGSASSTSSTSRSTRRLGVSSDRPLPSMAIDGGHDKTHHPHEDSTQTANKETALSWSAASRTAAACLATAAILSSSLPAGAGLVGGDLGSSLMPGRGGAPVNAMMLVADEGELASADGRADVTQIISELRKADRADSVLNSMVKINDAVDSDEDGLLENPFAKEVCVRCLCVCMVLSCVFKVKYRVVENNTV